MISVLEDNNKDKDTLIAWPYISFYVPALAVPVYTVNAFKKKVVKKDAMGKPVMDSRIIPKERPRFGKTKYGKSVTYTAPNTVSFEKHIRKCFFEACPGTHGIYYKGNPFPVHSMFLGCRCYNDDAPCIRFREGRDFLDCQVCSFRRKNLSINLNVFIKDDRQLDLDNVLKIALDALNKICFYDDTQFVVKKVFLIPYAEKEYLHIKLNVVDPVFNMGSFIGGYNIKKLAVPAAIEYINNIREHIKVGDLNAFNAYLRRCDKRKYIEKLIASWPPKIEFHDLPHVKEYNASKNKYPVEAATESFKHFITTPESDAMTDDIVEGDKGSTG